MSSLGRFSMPIDRSATRVGAPARRRPVLDPVGSLSLALPPMPAPEPVGDPATRDMVVAACHRAGLSLNEDQIAMICAAAPYVTAMTQWLRRERDFRDEPANIFQFPC